MGIKAHDICPYLCASCHDIVDGRTPGFEQRERDLLFYEALYLTVLWLLQEGYLDVV